MLSVILTLERRGIKQTTAEDFQIHQYAVLTQAISTIFIDQLPTYHAFRKVHSILVSGSSIAYHVISKILRMKRHNLKQH
jgi:hypothetical protein